MSYGSDGRHPRCVVTTSWDDGHPLDQRVADLLARYGLAGTFYVPLRNGARPTLGRAEVRDLAHSFEIGGHTLSHVGLPALPAPRAREEISGCKTALEDITGAEVVAFCYPEGKYDDRIAGMVAEAGYAVARTADWFRMDLPDDPYRLRPTVHAYPHSAVVDLAHLVRRQNPGGLMRYVRARHLAGNWKLLAMHLFERTREQGGVWHLWGHSWEVEQKGLWADLEEVLRFVAGRPEVTYCGNGDLRGLVRGTRA